MTGRDPLNGNDVAVLWLKGSGGDIGSIKMDGFATLDIDKLNALKEIYRSMDLEDEAASQSTGNHTGRARTPDELRADLEFAHGHIPRK